MILTPSIKLVFIKFFIANLIKKQNCLDAFKVVEGSKQELHLYMDLQAVEAKKLMSSTSELLH